MMLRQPKWRVSVPRDELLTITVAKTFSLILHDKVKRTDQTVQLQTT